jgi:protein-S-isoprenylcysteine O-methyltransferase Ste14
MKKVAITLGLALWVALFIGGILFLSAGRVDIPFFWANLLVWIGFMIIIASIMDTAFALIFLANSLALGSWLSCIPAVGFALFFIGRTVIEDKFLQENLEGYTGYIEKVPYRLIPGLW